MCRCHIKRRGEDGFLLALIPSSPRQPLPAGFDIGFALASPDEVAAVHGRLAAAAVRVARVEDSRPGEEYVTFRCWDADGTEIEVFSEPA